MKRLIFLLLLIPSVCSGATYNYYFSNSGNDATGLGTEASPWATMDKLKSEIDLLQSTDVVNLLFDRGSTWTYNTGVDAKVYSVVSVSTTNPIVKLDSYGTGDDPVFDGLVTDFDVVPVDDAVNGPLRYTAFFRIARDYSSVKNLEFKQMYGHAIMLDGANYTVISNNYFHHIGSAGVSANSNKASAYNEFSYNIVHTAQELMLHGKLEDNGWAGAVVFKTVAGASGTSHSNWMHHNIVYDVMGEGLMGANSIIEYNLVGDTCSTAIYPDVTNEDAMVGIVRYNMVIHSDYNTSLYNECRWIGDPEENGNGAPVGTRVYDENAGGDNSNGEFYIYGNVFINMTYGFRFFHPEDPGNQFKEVHIFNNTIIDSVTTNYTFQDPEETALGTFYNNVSILYDRPLSEHIADYGTFPHANWLIDTNAFWTTGGSPSVDSNWTNNYITTDPNLAGEPAINWTTDGFSIDFADVLPEDVSGIIDTGLSLAATFDDTYLTEGTVFSSTDPTASTFVTVGQPTSWTLGAAISGVTGYTIPTATSTVDCSSFCGGSACTSTDKLIIAGGARNNLEIQNCNGAGSYIEITNEVGNRSVISHNSGYGVLVLNNCKYVNLHGNSDSTLTTTTDIWGDTMVNGIKLINGGVPLNAGGLVVKGESEYIKLSYIESSCEGNTTGSGIGIQVQDGSLTNAWTFNNIEIFNNYIHDTRYSAMYLGHNDPADAGVNDPYTANFSVHDNVLENLGAYGITHKGVNGGTSNIYNNKIYTTGLVNTEAGFRHGIGIQMLYNNPTVNVYDNIIADTLDQGINVMQNDFETFSSGTVNIHDNQILGVGDVSNTDMFNTGILFRIDPNNTIALTIEDNIIVQPYSNGVRFESGTASIDKTITTDAGIPTFFIDTNATVTEGTGVDANIYYADTADAGFCTWSDDGDYTNDDFRTTGCDGTTGRNGFMHSAIFLF